MANAFSIVRRQKDYIPALNVADIERTLNVKQQNFDYNTAQVNQAIAQFGSIDLIRAEDREYLYNNLKNVIDIVNDTDNIDFSKSGIGSELSSYISKAIDGNVLKQAKNTMAIRGYETDLKKFKEDSPELYSVKNDNDAKYMAGYYKYMNGESNNLNNLNYTPFTDYKAEMLETIKTYKDIYPDQEVEFEDKSNPGYTIKKKSSQLNPNEWGTFLRQSLNSQSRAQLAIDGRAMYGYSDEKAVKDIKGIKDAETASIDDLIKIKEASKIGADTGKVELLEKEIAELEKNKIAVNSKYDVFKTAGQIGGYFLENQMIDSHIRSLSEDFLLGSGTDDAYFKNIKAMEGSGFGSQGIHTRTLPKNLEGIGNVVTNFEEFSDNAKTDLDSDLSKTFDNLSTEDKDKIETIKQLVTEEYIKENGETPTELQVNRMVIDRADKVLSPSDSIRLLEKIDQVDNYNRSKEDALNGASETLFTKHSARIYKELSSFSNAKIRMYNKNGEEDTFSNFLQNNNINSEEDFTNFINSNSEEAKLFKTNFLLQTIDFEQDNMYDFLEGAPRIRTGTYLQKNMKSFKTKMENVLELLGEDKSIDDIFRFKGMGDVRDWFNTGEMSIDQIIKGKKDRGLSGLNAPIRIEVKDPNSVLGKMFLKISEDRRFNEGLAGALRRDRTLRQDNVSNLFGEDKYMEVYEDKLNLSKESIAGQNAIMIEGKVEGKNTFIFRDLATLLALDMKTDLKIPLIAKKNPNEGYDFFQVHEFTISKNGSKEFHNATRVGYISESDLPDSFRNYINTEENESKLDYLTSINSERKNLSYTGSSAREGSELGEIFNANSDLGRMRIAMASKDLAVPYLKSLDSLRELNNSPQGAGAFAVANSVIKNANKFSIKLDSHGNTHKMKILMKDRDGKKIELTTIDLGGHNIKAEEFKKMYYGAEQVFLTMYLQQVLTSGWLKQDFSELNKIKNNL